MEEELRGLHAKWAKSQLNKHALVAAQHSVREKYEMSRTLATHNQLQELFLRQQVVFATLQSAIVGAPLNLRTSTTDIFKELHFDTRLGQGTEDRKRTLEAHNERSLRTLPSIINQFTQAKVDKMLKYQDKDITKASVSPTSQIDVTGGADYTLVSSVFMTDIPHTSLHDVYAGVLAFFDSITTWLKWHLGMNAMRTRLNDVEASPAYWCLDHESSFGLPATVNQVVCSELTESLGTVHLDAITDDPLHPSNLTEFGTCGLTITPRKEPGMNRITSVTLRWVVVYRYDMLPDDPALRKHVEMIRPILNGDLITASICYYIQELLRERSL